MDTCKQEILTLAQNGGITSADYGFLSDALRLLPSEDCGFVLGVLRNADGQGQEVLAGAVRDMVLIIRKGPSFGLAVQAAADEPDDDTKITKAAMLAKEAYSECRAWFRRYGKGAVQN